MSAHRPLSQPWADHQCLLTQFNCSATSLGMMNDEEKKMQRIEDIKELLS